jgi:hypothetical protein
MVHVFWKNQIFKLLASLLRYIFEYYKLMKLICGRCFDNIWAKCFLVLLFLFNVWRFFFADFLRKYFTTGFKNTHSYKEKDTSYRKSTVVFKKRMPIFACAKKTVDMFMYSTRLFSILSFIFIYLYFNR